MSKTFFPTIGLEIHAELKTRTKMFCNSKNDTEEKRPNVNVCAVCMGHPGTLPVVNKEAVKSVLKVGLAVAGELADYTEFDRKNYFYPDIPKGYQISQYAYPLVKGGMLSGVALTRVHLEEDTARSSHGEGDDVHSLVDFNRAGVPLMELVTEPVIHDAETAVQFAKELQLLLRYLGVSDANMEKGEMRVEANISVSAEKGVFGKKVEVKNLNSFKAVERAIRFELKRHEEVLIEGGQVTQETRGWDENKGETFSQRLKEESHDYRYFPDPDIPKLQISEVPEFSANALRKELPELPWQKRERLVKEYSIKNTDADVYVANSALGTFFEEVVRLPSKSNAFYSLTSNYIVSDLMGLVKGADTENISPENIGIKPADFAELIKMVESNKISSRGAKDILKVMHDEGGSPEIIAKERGMLQESNADALRIVVSNIISQNKKIVDEYKAGKVAALQYLIGQCMKESKGTANPGILKELLVKILD